MYAAPVPVAASSGKSAWPLAAICCLGLLGFLIAATIVLALIPVYLPNNSTPAQTGGARNLFVLAQAPNVPAGTRGGTVQNPGALGNALGVGNNGRVVGGVAQPAGGRKRAVFNRRQATTIIMQFVFEVAPILASGCTSDSCVSATLSGLQQSISNVGTFTSAISIITATGEVVTTTFAVRILRFSSTRPTDFATGSGATTATAGGTGATTSAGGASDATTSAGGASGATTSAGGASGESTTAGGASGESTTAGGASGESTTAGGASGESTTAGGASGESTTAGGASGQSTTAGGASGESTTAGGASGASTSAGASGASTSAGASGASTSSGASGASTSSGASGASTSSGASGASTSSGASGASTSSGSSGASTTSGGSSTAPTGPTPTSFTTAQSGPYFAASTWAGGIIPTGNITNLTIQAGHNITIALASFNGTITTWLISGVLELGRGFDTFTFQRPTSIIIRSGGQISDATNLKRIVTAQGTAINQLSGGTLPAGSDIEVGVGARAVGSRFRITASATATVGILGSELRGFTKTTPICNSNGGDIQSAGSYLGAFSPVENCQVGCGLDIFAAFSLITASLNGRFTLNVIEIVIAAAASFSIGTPGSPGFTFTGAIQIQASGRINFAAAGGSLRLPVGSGLNLIGTGALASTSGAAIALQTISLAGADIGVAVSITSGQAGPFYVTPTSNGVQASTQTPGGNDVSLPTVAPTGATTGTTTVAPATTGTTARPTTTAMFG